MSTRPKAWGDPRTDEALEEVETNSASYLRAARAPILRGEGRGALFVMPTPRGFYVSISDIRTD